MRIRTEIHIGYYLVTVLLFLFLSIAVVQAYDIPEIVPVGCTLLLGIVLWRCRLRLTVMDGVILLLLLFAGLQFGTTINGRASFGHLIMEVTGFLFYFLIRISLRKERKQRLFLLLSSLFFAALASVACVSFRLFRDAVWQSGFESLYDFKFLYRPLGNLTNVWGSYLIIFLGFCILAIYHYRKSRKAVLGLGAITLPILFGLIVTFSRGIYIVCCLLLLVAGTTLLCGPWRWKKKTLTGLIVMGSILLLAYPYRSEVKRTLRMTETVSQQRSLHSRMEAGTVVWNILREYPVAGVGGGNFTLAANEYLFEDDDNSYTSFAMSGVYQLAVEKGAAGMVLWGMLLILTIVHFFRFPRNGEAGILFCFLWAAVLREISFPVFFGSPGMQIMIFTLLAMFENRQEPYIRSWEIPTGARRTGAFAVWGIGAALIVGYTTRNIRERHNEEFLRAWEAGDFPQAEMAAEKTGDAAPYLFNKALFYKKRYGDTGDPIHLSQAKRCLQTAMRDVPKDVMFRYQYALLFQEEGKRDSALLMLAGLVEKHPQRALYQWTYGNLLIGQGDTLNAADCFKTAIRLTPAYLERLTALQDTAVIQHVVEAIQKEAMDYYNNKMQKDPVLLAKYGKILLDLNYEHSAQKLLNEAVSILPNLFYPWHYLGQIAEKQGDDAQANRYERRFLLLTTGNYVPDKELERYRTYIGSNARNNEYDFYLMKFEEWYDSRTKIDMETERIRKRDTDGVQKEF